MRVLQKADRVSFELFDSRGRSGKPTVPAGAPSVTVTDNRLLLVNRTATEALGEPARVLLFFDRDGRLAGIRKADDGDPRSYSATPRSNGKQVSVAASRFVRHHEIADGKYPAEMEDGMLVFGVGPAKG
jgi:hypothetical protein